MNGTNARTGALLSGDAHLAQSIADILTTPIGSRVMRRDYGSLFFELLDSPMNPLGRLRLFAATAQAIRRWEKRIRLTRVALIGDNGATLASGRFVLQLEGTRTDDPAPTTLTRLTVPLHPPV